MRFVHDSSCLHRDANICTDWVVWAHSQCAERPPRDFLASCTRRLCNRARGSAFARLSSYHFCRRLTGTYDEVGRLGRDLLSIIVCSL